MVAPFYSLASHYSLLRRTTPSRFNLGGMYKDWVNELFESNGSSKVIRSIAIAMASEGDALILDEPFSLLSQEEKEELTRFLLAAR